MTSLRERKKADTRTRLSVAAVELLVDHGVEGATVAAYDPVAADECRRIYGERDDLVLAASPLEAVRGAEALFIVTEWKEFRAPAFDEIHRRMKQPLVFDGRNLYDPRAMRRRGFEYRGIGRR